jgi:hypothetical protein
VFAALALVLAGCGTPGGVDEYNADTRENFELTCRDANGDPDDADVIEMCGCWVRTVEDNLSFDEFKDVEDAIREALDQGTLNNAGDLERIAPAYYELITENCVPVGPNPD